VEKPNVHRLSGILARIRKDQSGNVLAIAAAATLPLIGMVGGAVDVSRAYAVRIGLQAACDAGALTGRKTMSSGPWNTASINMANSVFNANFKNTAFGSTGLTKNFTGVDGTVTGTASATVPMTLMSIFGAPSKTVSVTCTSTLRIPHTDVMFVLDTTGSMNCAPGDTTATCTNNGGVEKTDARIKGLRTAVNCFVETMAKADTGEVCSTTAAPDPTPTGLSASVQLRVGFVPYSSNINVGTLLPTAYFANSRTFQSKVPITTTVQTWANSGASVPSTPSAWAPITRPTAYNTTYNNTAQFGTFATDLGTTTGTFNVNVTGGTAITLQRRITGATSANCNNNNNYSTTPTAATRIRAIGDLDGTVGAPSYGTYSTPTYPAANRTRTNSEGRTNRVLGYRYIWHNSSSTCRLYEATSVAAGAWGQARNFNESQPISWTAVQELTGWTLQPTTVNVGGLKNGTNWNSSVTIPNATSNTMTVQKSGSATSQNITIPAAQSVNWSGCIEERQTYLNTDADPSDDWDSMPAAAIDMDIDRVPDATQPSTLWGFALPDLVYGRFDGSGNRTTANVTTGTNPGGTLNTLACPARAQLLSNATDASDPTRRSATNVRTYTNSLIATGGTYHDIGLLWGARLMSPTGIFQATNALDASGNAITRQRHMVFMTDGGTGTCSSSYTPYGVSWWDRRQTNKANPNDDGATSCSNSFTNAITDARTELLCNEIKNKNITIWVVSFGLGVDTATETRLRQCASSVNHFYDANSTAALKTAFEEIALQISRLRLQN
jgi:Flp pilus assembly protein TadG